MFQKDASGDGLSEVKKRCSIEVYNFELYEKLGEAGLELGRRFRTIRQA